MKQLKKYRYYGIALLSSVVFALYFSAVFSSNHKPLIKAFQQQFSQKEKELNRFLDLKKDELKHNQDFATWSNYTEENQFYLHVFKNDSLIWMLFNRCNRTASADDLVWEGQKWSIVNHFIPYTEEEVDAPDRFESDFMVQHLADKTLSEEATAVLDAGRQLWRAYFAHTDVRTVRDQYKLNRPDVGWYQIRNALAERNKSGDTAPVNFTPFESAYQALTNKLRPQVFSLGFLR